MAKQTTVGVKISVHNRIGAEGQVRGICKTSGDTFPINRNNLGADRIYHLTQCPEGECHAKDVVARPILNG